MEDGRSHAAQVGRYTRKRVPFRRRLTMESLDAVPQGHYMLALLELDVTDALSAVEAQKAAGTRVSLFSFVAQCIATVLAEQPSFNAIRGGSKIYEFEDVDLNIPVEREASSGPAPHLLVVRRAARKSAAEIYAEIEGARRNFAAEAAVGREDRRAQRLMRVFLWLPKLVRSWALCFLAGRPLLVKRLTGTTFLTSVEKFSGLRGFVVPYLAGPVATSFTIGSTADKALARDGSVVVRRCLSMTVAFNHDIVDGGPAARFATRLAHLIENPALIAQAPTHSA